MFLNVCNASPLMTHERMEVVDSVLFSQLIMDSEARLQKIFKQLELFGLPVERGHRCRE